MFIVLAVLSLVVGFVFFGFGIQIEKMKTEASKIVSSILYMFGVLQVLSFMILVVLEIMASSYIFF